MSTSTVVALACDRLPDDADAEGVCPLGPRAAELPVAPAAALAAAAEALLAEAIEPSSVIGWFADVLAAPVQPLVSAATASAAASARAARGSDRRARTVQASWRCRGGHVSRGKHWTLPSRRVRTGVTAPR